MFGLPTIDHTTIEKLHFFAIFHLSTQLDGSLCHCNNLMIEKGYIVIGMSMTHVHDYIVQRRGPWR